ncbi:hypothetical protein [Gordoniibacillus kamchatkensis]|nr:hypothetical protein [Paenibacillus sp. VKM B-2647]
MHEAPKLAQNRHRTWDGRPIADTPQASALQALGAERDRSSFVLWPSQLG